MQTTLTLGSIAALFSAMVVLAALPSVSVLAVSTRSASGGFLHGALTTLGIVVGDVVFIVLALWGLAVLRATLGDFFVVIPYLGAVYLMFLGIGLWRSLATGMTDEKRRLKSRLASFLASFLTGLFITLGDQKAALFYLGFFPAFLDVSQVSVEDTAIIVAIAVGAVGGVKLVYAALADRARTVLNPQRRRGLNRLAGGVMIAIAVFLVVMA
ncbi:MAG: LysE family translocator [Leptolyngbyaceae cyanobacterium T60_A2020_046]|nr:LysE family translocator [Leptolyngbyaceae cyanobacterium T60_A2020_046]